LSGELLGGEYFTPLSSGAYDYYPNYVELNNFIWKSDGTTVGTSFVSNNADYQAGAWNRVRNRNQSIVFQGKLYFSAYGRLSVTDGTNSGTYYVKKILPDSVGRPSNIDFLTMFKDKIYFVAEDDTFPLPSQLRYNRELWVSDGTESGTHLFVNIYPGRWSSFPAELTVAGGKLYFSANDSIHGRELWETDGTVAGTKMVYDLNPGVASSNPHNIYNAGDFLYFFAETDSLGSELYKLELPPSIGVKENNWQTGEMKIYPNPSDGIFQLEPGGTSGNDIGKSASPTCRAGKCSASLIPAILAATWTRQASTTVCTSSKQPPLQAAFT